MKFDPPLVEGRLLRRYKRFLSDIELPGHDAPFVAHCPNPGSMMGLAEPGFRVWLTPVTNPKAKLKWRWDLVDSGSSLVCINTGLANRLVPDAIADGHIPELSGYGTIRREVKYGTNSRIDILLEDPEKPPAYVEIKSVTLRRDTRPKGSGLAEFSDSVTKRGTKHLHELTEVKKQGARAIMLFLVLREDCDHFTAARDIDPVYAEALDHARASNVEILCYSALVTTEGMEIGRRLAI